MVAFLVAISLVILLVVGGTLISGRLRYSLLSYAGAGSHTITIPKRIVRSETANFARRSLLILTILFGMLSIIFIGVLQAIAH